MVGWRDSNGDLIARQLSSKPRPYDAGGDGGKGLSHLCLERLAYVPVLPEVLRGALPACLGPQGGGLSSCAEGERKLGGCQERATAACNGGLPPASPPV